MAKRSIQRRMSPGVRRGSVLIFVVAILTLLALIGTAFIATTRIDRQATPSGEPDLLPGLQDQVVNTIRDDAYDGTGTGRYRPGVPQSTVGTTRYEHWDSGLDDPTDVMGLTSHVGDKWLGERVPAPWDPTVTVSTTMGGGNPLIWRSLTRPLNGDPNLHFESPYYDAATNSITSQGIWSLEDTSGRQSVTVPTSVTITYPTSPITPGYDPAVAGMTRVFPAFYLYNMSGTTLSSTPVSGSSGAMKYIAGDADGDGIADCGLWRLGQVGDVTYFAGVRIFDNNSAININTAWSRDTDYAFGTNTASTGQAYFPANVGLLELFSFPPPPAPPTATATQQMQYVNRDRFNYPSTATTYTAGQQPVVDPDNLASPATPASARTDFNFTTEAEAHFFQVTRRLDNPGYRVLNGPLYAPYSTSITSPALDYHFGFVNPNQKPCPFEYSMLQAGQTTSQVDTVYGAAPNYSNSTAKADFTFFPASEVLYWYLYNYEFNDVDRNSLLTSNYSFTTVPPRPVRSLLVSSNPVSNHIPVHYSFSGLGAGGATPPANVINDGMLPYGVKGRWSNDQAYSVNDLVIHYNSTITPRETRLYLCVTAQPKGTGAQPGTGTYWVPVTPQGEYITGHSYAQGDLVRAVNHMAVHEGCDLFIATGATSATPPNKPWLALYNQNNPPKVSLNTAPFAELWRGFWNAMSTDDVAGNYFADYKQLVLQSSPNSPWTSPSSPLTANSPDNQFYFPDDNAVGGYAAFWYDPYQGCKYTNNWSPGQFLNAPVFATSPTTPYPLQMFRSSIRDDNASGGTQYSRSNMPNRFRAIDMVQLRAALAAVNTQALLDVQNDIANGAYTGAGALPTIPTRTIRINAIYHDPKNAPADTANYANNIYPAEVTVYGYKPQPFIAEIYANTDTVSDYAKTGQGPSNPAGYVAVKLYNPYPFPISIGNWVFAALDRKVNRSQASYPTMQVPDPSAPVITIPGGTVVPAGGYLTFDNYGASTTAGATGTPATVLPPFITDNVPNAAAFAHLPGLEKVLDHEMTLLRPPSAAAQLALQYWTWVPVDSYDFTGLVAGGGQYYAWHYVRASGVTGAGAGLKNNTWNVVYPGRYDAIGTAAPDKPRQQGTQVDKLFMGTDGSGNTTVDDPWDPQDTTNTPSTPPPGANDGAVNFTQNGDMVASYDPVSSTTGNLVNGPLHSIPLCADPTKALMAAMCWPSNSGATTFPYNGFGHAGEVLEVPFIGSYSVRILSRTTGTYLVPTVAIAGDSVLELNSISMDSTFAEDTLGTDDAQEQIGRFCPLPRLSGVTGPQPYDWAANILDHFTAIQNPNDDFLPNVDPARYPTANPTPAPVANVPGAPANGPAEQDTPIQGLININTAPWPVLAMAPLQLTSAGNAVDQGGTVNLAKQIVQYRNQHGPFKSLFDLNNIPGFQVPGGTGTDFMTSYRQIMRLSNVLTTRSDSFTVYLLVQGWKKVGTAYPQLVSEQRSAFIVDRSNLTANTTTSGGTTLALPKPVVIPIPSN